MRYSLVLLALLPLVDGCRRSSLKGNAGTHETGGAGAPSCEVVVYSPPYGGTRQPDSVEVLWDGERMFSGRLPVKESLPSGMPVRLLEIKAAPGEHTIEVHHEGRSERRAIILDANESKHVRLLTEDKQDQLILISVYEGDASFQ